MPYRNLLTAILIAVPIACCSLTWAQQPEPADTDQETLNDQIEQARMKLAEAAQYLARLQHEQLRERGNLQVRDLHELEEKEFRFKFEMEPGQFPAGQIIHMGFGPRLGVLLGSSERDEENLVVGVTPGSGADKAGIQQGDRLISLDGHDVTRDTGERIKKLLSDLKAGDTVDVLVARGDHTELAMPVTIETALSGLSELTQRLRPALESIDKSIIHVLPHGDDRLSPPLLPRLTGLGRDTQLISNHEGLAPYFGIDEGVIVLRIGQDNPLNLESGDVILSIDGERISRPVDLGRELLHRDSGEQIIIQVMRHGTLTELSGHIPEQTRSGMRVINLRSRGSS